MGKSPEGFYVYELIDPRTSEAFYVGKGKGRRAWVHEADELRGSGCNAIKRERIGQIRRAGLRVEVSILADGLSEREAYRLERVQIVSRHERLTNISLTARTPLEVVAAECREGLAKLKPLCTLIREGASAERLKAWTQIHAGLARVHALSV